jgi:hypothetical protein
METILYRREKGPQCLRAPIVSRQQSAEDIVRQILSFPPTWYWSSAREEGQNPLQGQPELPITRPLTLLNGGNAHELVIDIDEFLDEGPAGAFRFLILIGLDCELAAPIKHSLDTAMNRFLTLDLGPVETAFIRLPDMPEEYVYFRHETIPAVRSLFNAWQLDPTRVRQTLPYSRLRIAQLESIYAGIKDRLVM